MATKYGYVSRDTANRQIDWGAVGTQVSDSITKITEDRKERREDILTKSTDYAKMLIDMPMGSNTAFNEYLAQFTTQASKAALEDLNLLKSGNISEQEYYNRRANLLSGTELMIAGADNFNKNYDVIQERIDNGTASAVEIKYRQKMAELLEFGNRTPFINPDTREVNTARLAPSGIMETTVEDIASASDMFRISNFQLNKFDMNTAIEDITKNIGIQDVTITPEMVKKAQSEGRTIGAVGTKVKGAFNSALMSEKETELAKKDYVSSYLKDDSVVISILADYVPGYDVTLDPFEVDDKTVLIGRNGAYEITDEQRKAAEEYMIDRLDKALPETQTPSMTEAEKRAEDRAERRLQVEEKRLGIAIEQLGLEKKTAQGSYEDGDNLIVLDNSSTDVAKNYVKNLTRENFTGENLLDTIDNFQTLFRKQKYNVNSELDVTKTPVKIKRLGKETLVNLSAIKLFVPDVMDKPLFIPIATTEQDGLFPGISEPGERINLILRLIDRAEKQGIKLTDDSFRSIMKDDFDKYNPVLEENSPEIIEEASDNVIVKPEKGTLG
jgi:hypothetical protein